MQPAPENGHGNNTDKGGYLPADIPATTIYSYNLDDRKTPGGIKVRWKWRVIEGPAAARYDARQAEAIMEALRWTARHQRQLRAAQEEAP
jgi:hypothetical protein